jgi:hypothetical protein
MEQSLKQLLLRDWGTDLPICGGFGQNRDDPIIVTATDPLNVAQTEMLVLRGLGRGREVFWRMLGRSLLGSTSLGLEQLKIEVVQLTADQIITTREKYYFDTRACISANGAVTETVLVSYSDASGLVFPYEIGWLHFNSLTEYEAATPGLGVGLGYGAPGIKGTIYVYDQERRDIPDAMGAPWLHTEFESSSDALTSTQNVEPCPDLPVTDGVRMRLYSMGEEAHDATVLWMTTARGKIIKARATWNRDRFIDDVARNFLKSISVTVGLSKRIDS